MYFMPATCLIKVLIEKKERERVRVSHNFNTHFDSGQMKCCKMRFLTARSIDEEIVLNKVIGTSNTTEVFSEIVNPKRR